MTVVGLFLRAVCVFVGLATATLADDVPAHFRVTDVAADDRLNIRAMPDAGAYVVGDYGPYQLNIEVMRTSADGRWGYVGTAEGNGWVAMRYLERQNHLAVGEFPRPFQCSGTEPFWTVDFGIKGTTYSDLATATTYPLETLEEDVSHNGAALLGGTAVLLQDPSVLRTVIFKAASCSDGMSDREFAWSAVLLTQIESGLSFETGCCTMQAN